MLHLIHTSTPSPALMAAITAGDAVVMLDAAVCRLLTPDGTQPAWLQQAACYSLAEHLQQYGIAQADLFGAMQIIDYAGLVELIIKHPQNCSWP